MGECNVCAEPAHFRIYVEQTAADGDSFACGDLEHLGTVVDDLLTTNRTRVVIDRVGGR